MDPLIGKLTERREQRPGSRALGTFGARVTGFEAGALLAFLSGKVLGQYELFPPGGGPGRPAAGRPEHRGGRAMARVDPQDFRLWVCLHEETHRVQFNAVPWLREHLLGLLREYLDEAEVDPAVLMRRTVRRGRLVDAVRRRGEGSLLDAVQTPGSGRSSPG